MVKCTIINVVDVVTGVLSGFGWVIPLVSSHWGLVTIIGIPCFYFEYR